MEIGISPLYGIGDTLLFTPALKVLKEKYPEYKITVFTFFKTTHDVLLYNPSIDELVYFPMLRENKIKTLLFLKKYMRKFDVVINFYPSNRREYNLFAFLLLPKKIIGHKYIKNSLLNFNFLKSWQIEEDYSLHVVEENLHLLKFFNIESPPLYPLQIFLTKDELNFGKNYIAPYKNRLKIGIHPGTSSFKNHDKRRWPLEHFIELGKLLREYNENIVIFIFGGPEERPLKEFIHKNLKNTIKTVIVDTKSIRETASIMNYMNAFISNDSGLMHLASALRLPVIGIFGPTNPVWVAPWKTPHRIVRLNLPCSPCFYYSPKPLTCPQGLNFKCLRELGPEKVYKAFLSLMEEIKKHKKEGIFL